MRPQWTALLFALLVTVPALAPAASAEAGWDLVLEDTTRNPDTPDAFTLHLVHGANAPGGLAHASLHVNFTDPDGGSAAWSQAAGVVEASPHARVAVAFNATHGPGTYRVDVVLSAPAGTAAVRDVVLAHDADGAEGRFRFDVPDAPTHLAFTRDSVNDPGKTKAPGSDLITRVTVSDENGLADLTLAFTYHRLAADGARVPVDRVTFTDLDAGDAAATTADVEARWNHAPVPAGDYVENVSALAPDGSVLAAVERPFHITARNPVLLGDPHLAPEPVVPDRPHVLETTIRIASANLGTGPLDDADITALGIVDARLYWWSRVVTDPGWSVVLGTPASGEDPMRLDLRDQGHRTSLYAYEIVEDAGAFTVPVRVQVPAGVPAGDYRVTLFHRDAPDVEPQRLGTVPFTVSPLPRLSALTVNGDPVPGEALDVAVTVADAPADILRVRLLAPDGAVVAAAEERDVTGDVALRFTLPPGLVTGAYTLDAWAAPATDSERVEDGPGVRQVTLHVDAGPARLELAADDGADALRVGPHAPAAFTLTAWNATVDDPRFTLVDAEGGESDATARVTRRADGVLALSARGLPAGAYTLRAVVATAENGTLIGELSVRVDAWLGVRLPQEPARLSFTEDGRLAGEITLASDGNVRVKRVLTLVGPFPDGRPVTGVARVVGADGSVRAEAALDAGRAHLAGVLLDAFEADARLVVDLDAPPGLPAGSHEMSVRVLLVPGNGGGAA